MPQASILRFRCLYKSATTAGDDNHSFDHFLIVGIQSQECESRDNDAETSIPSVVPIMDPRPPDKDVPPMTAMAIASSSYIRPMPDWAVSPRAATTIPAKAASEPAIV